MTIYQCLLFNHGGQLFAEETLFALDESNAVAAATALFEDDAVGAFGLRRGSQLVELHAFEPKIF